MQAKTEKMTNGLAKLIPPCFDGWLGITPDTQWMANSRWQAVLWRRQVYRAIDAVRAFQLPVIPD